MKRFLIITLFALVSMPAFSQFLKNSEMGITFGGGNYMGDINPKYNLYGTKIMYGLIYRYNFNPRWVIKASAMFGSVGAEDSHFNNIRNLSFESKINELAATCEFNFFDYQTGSKKHRVTPYIFAGIGVFFMNPKTEILNPLTYEREWVDLQPLNTEGQGMDGYDKPYSLTQISVPFGLGLKVSLNSIICIGFEWGLRMTFTDYIDDVSKNYVDRSTLAAWSGEVAVTAADRTNEILPLTYNEGGTMRGNPQTTDWYQFFGVTITTKIPHKSKCITF